MSDAPSDFEPQKVKPAGIFGTVFLILFATPFAGLGLVAVFAGIKKWVAGNHHDGPMLCLLGAIFSTVGFGLMFAAVWSQKKARQTVALKTRYADKPWMMREDWAAGKIKPSDPASLKFLLLWAVLALALSAPVLGSFPQEWHQHNYGVLVVLLFPLLAFGLIGYVIIRWRSRRRFGQCFFELAQIPIPLDGTLNGLISVGGRLKLEHGLHLTFSCIRRVVTGAGKNRSVQEEILWQEEKVYKNEMTLPEPEPGHTGIPIFFQLPEGKPQCFSLDTVSVLWRLEAKAKLAGPDFQVRFELPVFKVAGAVVDVGTADPTAALQAPIEEVRRDENSRIKVSNGPAGREFYFPAARNIGTTLMVTLFFLVWSGIVWALATHRVSLFFTLTFGAVDVLIFWGLLIAWFKSSRVAVNPTQVQVTKRYLVFGRQRNFSTGDIARFETKPGMQSGSQVFTDIRLILRGADEEFAARNRSLPSSPNVNQAVMMRMRAAAGPRGVTVASSIATSLEAEWLVREMNDALGCRNAEKENKPQRRQGTEP